MLFSVGDINVKQDTETQQPLAVKTQGNISLKGKPKEALKKHLSVIKQGDIVNFVTSGRWSMHDLLFHLLSFTGPANVDISTWSISELVVRQVLDFQRNGQILSCRFLLDKKVKVRNPAPLQLITQNFPHQLIEIHAKVLLIQNYDWKITVIGSANMNQNRRVEAGVIFTQKEIYDFNSDWYGKYFAANN
jgi:hypothetical protein